MSHSKSWTEETAKTFWANRLSYAVITDTSLSSKLEEMKKNSDQRVARLQNERSQFLSAASTHECAVNQPSIAQNVVDSLCFWTKYLSWTYCDTCHLLKKQTLPPNFAQKTITKRQACICKMKKYIIPDWEDIPLALSFLEMEDVIVLRPFDMDSGNYQRMKHGYRVKTGAVKLTTSQFSVEQKISALSDPQSRQRCTQAYAFLMNCSQSSYRNFVELRQNLVDKSQQLSLFNLFNLEGIECALWPCLYPFTKWCESSISGKENRESTKVAFFAKVFSNILDYATSFELLLFQYDRWLFKTVTGAINSARVLKCSPLRALDTKTFSPGYWQWQHRFLLDAVSQFGLPSMFLTISPYEWTFPFPLWLEGAREATGLGPTRMAAYETIHIANTLEQMVRGYLCGSNSARWSQHVFHCSRDVKEKNVLTYFYRLEFQGRGTLHLHLLVWLKELKSIQFQRIRADIPKHDHYLGFLADKLQKSDKKSACLNLQREPTHIENNNNDDVLSIIHPANAFAKNLRAYIDTLLPTLKCSMDVQTTDGRSMLLRYVSSYVSKWHDAVDVDSLYSQHVSAHQAAFRYLCNLKPCEPEMWLALSSVKIAWSSSRTKRYIVPFPDKAAQDKVAMKYRQRPQSLESCTFQEWLRLVDHTPTKPKPYKTGNTLVGLKFTSVYRNEFFFQQLLMHLPHRKLTDLEHGGSNAMPVHLKYFASASLFLEKWNDMSTIRHHFEMEGHKNHYIETVLSYVASLNHMLFLWRLNVIKSHQLLDTAGAVANFHSGLQGKQLAIFQHFKTAIACREQSFRAQYQQRRQNSANEGHCSDDLVDDTDDDENVGHTNYTPHEFDWKKYLLVTGFPGCGKTHTLNACISECVQRGLKVCVVAPTGFLACKFKATFGDDISTNTVHGAFKYPVDENESPTINWELAHFDFLVVDEISMIPKPIFHHIMKTITQLPVRPIVFFSGDEAQQQPIMTVNQKIVQVENIMSDPKFLGSIFHQKLNQQFRCEDPKLQTFLNHIRSWKPKQELLDSIQKKVYCEGEPSDNDILSALQSHPDATVLTMTKKASARINNLVIEHAFQGNEPLLLAPCDWDSPPIPIYQGMKIMLTQNRNKARGFVNGQTAILKTVQGKTVFASLPDGQIINIYLVTYKGPDGKTKTVYPFAPAYANTICKAQGQTLSKVLLWLDIDNIPPGAAYVAVSRVRTLDSLFFLTRMKVCHFRPII